MNFKDFPDAELYTFFHELKAEMSRRKLAIDVGKIGEERVIEFFSQSTSLPNLTDAAPGTKNVDALSRHGERYSIKTVLTSIKTSSIYPEPEDEKQSFEYMVILKLNSNFSIKEMYRISWAEFLLVRAWDKRMSSWYVPVNKKRLKNVERIV
ncbi:hypothetical protein [Marinobacter excellens]|uniref:hypothetical protein n=1 Tax=Marinobacter excellens TaxID=218670 RepID=UPI0012E793C4|nr:hypothetical protein [Marinobacter excellens]